MPKKKGFKDMTDFMSAPSGKKKQTKKNNIKKEENEKKQIHTKTHSSPKKKASMEQFSKAFSSTSPKKASKKQGNNKKEEFQNESDSKSQDIEPIPEKKMKPFVKQYFPKNNEPIGDLKYTFDMDRKKRQSQKEWHLDFLNKSNEFVFNMEKGILLTVEYSGDFNKAYAKFYDLTDNKIKMWMDTTNHEPYCLYKETKEELSHNHELVDYPGFSRMETVKKIDLLQDKEIEITKIYGKTPSDIGGSKGIKTILGGAWESNIRYHHNYIYDNELVPGMSYTIKEGKLSKIEPTTDHKVIKSFMEIFKDEAPEMKEIAGAYQELFYTPVPDLKRMAFDIEVEDTAHGGIPNPRSAKEKIISIAFASNDGKKMVYCLDRIGMEIDEISEDFPDNAEVYFFKEEKTLLEETFRLIWEYPIVITFNGDNFDNMYLYHRARRLKIEDEINPIYTKRGGGMVSTHTLYKHSIHLDIFQFYANRSIKGYAFGNAYLQNSLEEVSKGMLGDGKIKHAGETIGEMSLSDLIYYNLTDSLLTLELTTFNDNLMFHLLVILMRMTKLPMQDLFRLQISTWIKSLMISEHRRRNFLIPRKRELNPDQNYRYEEPTISGKGFKGAYVIKPIPGIHFDVAVLDFSSLYPSIIKTRNLSYETVNCNHQECEDNMLPNTNNWSCTKRMGIFSYVVGYFRDVRVNWFKGRIKDESLSEEEQKRANVMASALKIFINGCYGVFGSPVFQFYSLPVAESTTAIGRFSIQQTIEKSEGMGIKVLYGDSDSVFLHNPSEEQVKQLIEWSISKLDLDLELEKIYQFLALSERKKNYIGVYKGGNYVDIKGLMAKKHNTPEFIKNRFLEFQNIIRDITTMDDFKKNRPKLIKIVKDTINLIGKPTEEGGFAIEDYAITIQLKKPLDKYDKTTPQHVRAAMMLEKKDRDKIEPGAFIKFVKTRSNTGVKPLKHTTLRDIDYEKYKELVQSTFEQVLDALQISYQEIKGVRKLSTFF